MMKEILEDFFGVHYNSTKQVTASCSIAKGVISLSDTVACADCTMNASENEGKCDKIVLQCNTQEHEIEVIKLEEFISQYQNLKSIQSKRTCDLLLVDNRKVAFCELTCSNPKYISSFSMRDGRTKLGKRHIAKEQISNSVALLTSVPQIAEEINMMDSKIGLFAYREKTIRLGDSFDIDSLSKMRDFGTGVEAKVKEPMFSDMGYGFVFTEVRFPDVYKW